MIKFKIVENRKIWFSISSIVIIIGLVSMLTRGFNLGIDFTGGTIMELKFEKTIAIEQVREVLKAHGLENSIIQMASSADNKGKDDTVIIRTQVLDESVRQKVAGELESKVGKFDVLRIEKVGSVIGGELTQKAIMAIVVSWLLMIGYITWRFEFKFAISGIIALVQDVLVVMSFFSIFQIEIDSTFVAALLTIIGFSINDTIVIFDRIRENLRSYRRSDSLEELVNRSIWQTMSRSLYTVGTVLFVTVSLYIFGGDTTRNFSMAMIIGFSFGCFTSIFCCGSFWLVLQKSKPAH